MPPHLDGALWSHSAFKAVFLWFLSIALSRSSSTLSIGPRTRSALSPLILLQFSSGQLLSRVRLFATPRTAAHQASLSITNSRSPPKPTSIESEMPSHPLSSPSPSALNLSQHQGVFKWVSSSHQEAKPHSFPPQDSVLFPPCLASFSPSSELLGHSSVLGLNLDVSHSGKPLTLALSHHPNFFFLLNIDFYLQSHVYLSDIVPCKHEIGRELPKGKVFVSFVHQRVPSFLKGCIFFLILIQLSKATLKNNKTVKR